MSLHYSQIILNQLYHPNILENVLSQVLGWPLKHVLLHESEQLPHEVQPFQQSHRSHQVREYLVEQVRHEFDESDVLGGYPVNDDLRVDERRVETGTLAFPERC